MVMASLATAALGAALLVGGPGTASAEPARDVAAARQASEPLASYAQFRRNRVVVTRRVYRPGYRYYGGPGVAAGVFGGLAAGALIGGAIAAQQAPVYAAPGAVYAAPAGDAVEYCMQRFQSYDPQSGTYLGYDGLRHPCP
jgi:hypothetical protein